MTTSYSDASTHVLCDIVYVADNATANRIFLRVVETAEWHVTPLWMNEDRRRD